MKTATTRFLEAVGYPEKGSGGAASFAMQVDGAEIVVLETTGGALRLFFRVSDDASVFPRLAEWAAGRMLREDATLAYGQLPNVSPDGLRSSTLPPSMFLWRDLSSEADASAMRRAFEDFADSCDWWRARVSREGEAAASFPEMVIRP